MTESLIHAMVEMQEAEALQRAKQLLDRSTDPVTILKACSTAMETIGKRFENGEYFLPHLMLAGEMLKQISEMIKPLIREEKIEAGRGRVLLGTVKGDIPKGKALWWFDRTDMKRAKETVGRVACLAGNMPLDLLCTGTPGQVKTYCRNLIDVAGVDGGFIFSSGAGIQGSKAANVKAMIEIAKEYGVYD